MGDRQRRALAPRLERMEERELLSGLMVALGGRPMPPLNLARIASQAPLPPSSSSPLFGQGQPTPRELARERFVAVFSGPTSVGPGRFSDQSKIVFLRGVGGSNMFRHGDYQMAIVIPTNPSAPLIGEAMLEDKNNNSSGQVGLQLSGDQAAVDRLGRPTHLRFTADPNIYSGIFFIDNAGGTVDIHYSKNSATAVFQGLIYTTGLTSPLRNSDLVARGGRISPRSGR